MKILFCLLKYWLEKEKRINVNKPDAIACQIKTKNQRDLYDMNLASSKIYKCQDFLVKKDFYLN